MPKSLLAGWQRQDCCSSAARGPQGAGGFTKKLSSLMLHFALVYIFKGRGKESRVLPKSFPPGKLRVCWEGEGVIRYGLVEQLLPAAWHPSPAQPVRPDPSPAPAGAAAGQSRVQLHPPCVGLGAILFFLVSLVQMVSLGSACK